MHSNFIRKSINCLKMYAIVDIAGQQFKVEKDQKIFVNRLDGEEGAKVEFTDVLLVDTDGAISIGEPLVSGAVVNATILAHARGEKVKIFKKKSYNILSYEIVLN